MKTFAKILLTAGFWAVVCGYPMQARALPLYEFSFHQHSGFDIITMQGSHGGNVDMGWYQLNPNPLPGQQPPAIPLNRYYNTIAWGVPTLGAGGGLLANDPFGPAFNTGNPSTDLSGMRVLGFDGFVSTGALISGELTQFGPSQPISRVYHQNNAIYNFSATLKSVDVYSELVFDKDNTDFHTDANGILVKFTETPNQANPCDNPPPGGSMSSCDDYFSFDVTGLGSVFFTYGTHTYEAQFGLTNFVNSAVAVSGGTITVWTQENVTSSMDVIMMIREVPEPTVLILLGLGLLGLGIAKRREMKG